jgi:hypothetical protein
MVRSGRAIRPPSRLADDAPLIPVKSRKVCATRGAAKFLESASQSALSPLNSQRAASKSPASARGAGKKAATDKAAPKPKSKSLAKKRATPATKPKKTPKPKPAKATGKDKPKGKAKPKPKPASKAKGKSKKADTTAAAAAPAPAAAAPAPAPAPAAAPSDDVDDVLDSMSVSFSEMRALRASRSLCVASQIPQLKDRLRANDQVVGGTKAELAQRIKACLRYGCLPRCPQCFIGKLKWRARPGGSLYCPGGHDGDHLVFCRFSCSFGDVDMPKWTPEPGKLV